MPYKIDEDKCTNCGLCDTQCPVDAITKEEKHYHIHEDLCADCDACLDVCEANAIIKCNYKLSYVEEETEITDIG